MDIQKEREAYKAALRNLENEFFFATPFDIWLAAKREAQAVPEGNALLSATLNAVQKLGSGDFVLVPTKNIKYFSHDGENYEVHDTLEEAKHEAECAIESFKERLANQVCNPAQDGNFSQVGYGIVLAESGYSVDHIVTQEDVDNGEYGYEVGTEIMSLFLIEAQEQGHE
ncbi:hypothetical protein NVT87_14325 [Acinetobacter radioresistens]|uniref:hypothetical protein n=1 Tax=Acinetobacter radioresistens TaxID=40216 RepID=UPI00224536C4|nr:hypothetical protein [Acinetobacter radioresistens]MCX0332048.1 hypothetical protein [Acinetobacter radioresistens]